MARSLWFSCSRPTPLQPKIYGVSSSSSFSFPKFSDPKPIKTLKASFFDYPLASKIMVRNLSYSTSESCLQKEFSKFGKISEVKLVKDEARKKSKGYAFIQYDSQEAALQALENMDQKYVDGRMIYVELAKPDKHSYSGGPRTSGPPKEQNLLDPMRKRSN